MAVKLPNPYVRREKGEHYQEKRTCPTPTAKAYLDAQKAHSIISTNAEQRGERGLGSFRHKGGENGREVACPQRRQKAKKGIIAIKATDQTTPSVGRGRTISGKRKGPTVT